MSAVQCSRTGFVHAVALAFVALVLAVTLPSSAAMRRAGRGDVTFQVSVTGGLQVTGRSSELRVGESNGQMLVAVRLATLKTGIDLRDRHMRESLEAARFPDATLSVSRSALTFPAERATASGTASARLELHGQTLPVTFRYQATRKGNTYSVEGSTTIDMRAWGITPPRRYALQVKPNVAIEVSFETRDE